MSELQIPPIEFQEHRLENGLQVILHRNERVPLVHLTLHYRVGSSYEKRGKSGFAHLFEHMMFQGSENVPKTAHGKYVDQAGGRWNASTSKDRTNYYDTVPAHFLDLALWLEAERMRSLAVTGENFENQRRTVIEEKKQSYDNQPYGLAYLRFDELAYQNWSYAHSIIGSIEDLEAATLEDAQEFHGSFYGPGNATLVLTGDFDEREALEKISEHFQSIADRTRAQQPDLNEPEQTACKVEVMRDPLAVLPALYMGYHMAALGTTEYYALSLIGLVLAGGISSRFYRELVYRRNWITGLSAGPNQYRGPEMFLLWLQIQDQIDPKDVLNFVEEELGRIGEEGVSEEELEKARNQLSHRFVSRLATVTQVGELLARYAVLYDDPHHINREPELLMAVEKEQIQEVAKRVFQSRNQTRILIQPEKKS